MAEHTLASSSALGGYSTTYHDTDLQEVTTLQIVSLAVPQNNIPALNTKLQGLWSASFPETGQCLRVGPVAVAEKSCKLKLLGLQSDQCLVTIESEHPSTELPAFTAFNYLQTQLDGTAYLTEQSDSMVALDVKGSLTLLALERICMLDLSTFSSSNVARTVMEHLSVIVELPFENHARLYSPRSSANSFLHAVETSLINVAPGVPG